MSQAAQHRRARHKEELVFLGREIGEQKNYSRGPLRPSHEEIRRRSTRAMPLQSNHYRPPRRAGSHRRGAPSRQLDGGNRARPRASLRWGGISGPPQPVQPGPARAADCSPCATPPARHHTAARSLTARTGYSRRTSVTERARATQTARTASGHRRSPEAVYLQHLRPGSLGGCRRDPLALVHACSRRPYASSSRRRAHRRRYGRFAKSWEAALRAVGAVIEASQRVSDGSRQCVLSCPARHHYLDGPWILHLQQPRRRRCLAARRGRAQQSRSSALTSIGNGTWDAFYSVPTCHVSTHQYPHYWAQALTRGGSLPARLHTEDFAANGSGGEVTRRPQGHRPASELPPDFALVSLGFDAFWNGPLANMRLSVTGYAALIRAAVERAGQTRRCVGGRLQPRCPWSGRRLPAAARRRAAVDRTVARAAFRGRRHAIARCHLRAPRIDRLAGLAQSITTSPICEVSWLFARMTVATARGLCCAASGAPSRTRLRWGWPSLRPLNGENVPPHQDRNVLQRPTVRTPPIRPFVQSDEVLIP